MSSEESPEEMESRHRKELKSLDGEKRAAVKKTKGTKGKKAKEALAAMEAEYDAKLQQMKQRHSDELLKAGSSAATTTVAATGDASAATDAEQVDTEQQQESPEDVERLRKQEKARRKRERAREKEREKELRIQKETEEAGPSLRQIENEQIQQQLDPLYLTISQVRPDGNCLYRAVAEQCNTSYQEIRKLCATTLQEREEEFAPFCEYTGAVENFAQYVEQVRNSSEWGGHLELRALGVALKRPIIVYSAQSREPLVIKEASMDESDPIRLSYHLHYYALGEHYNQVVTRDAEQP